VRVFSRQLNDVTPAVPEVMDAVRRLPLNDAILDGEAIALRPDGTPLPFQVTMRRFGRKLDVARLRAELPLAPFFFDLLHADARRSWTSRTPGGSPPSRRPVPAGQRVPRLVSSDAGEAAAFFDRAIAAGQEGLMAKALGAIALSTTLRLRPRPSSQGGAPAGRPVRPPRGRRTAGVRLVQERRAVGMEQVKEERRERQLGAQFATSSFRPKSGASSPGTAGRAVRRSAIASPSRIASLSGSRRTASMTSGTAGVTSLS